MSKDATKWNGIKQMLSHFGVSPSEAVYFGEPGLGLHNIDAVLLQILCRGRQPSGLQDGVQLLFGDRPPVELLAGVTLSD